MRKSLIGMETQSELLNRCVFHVGGQVFAAAGISLFHGGGQVHGGRFFTGGFSKWGMSFQGHRAGSVSVFEVGIGFRYFFRFLSKVGSVFGFSKYRDIGSVSVLFIYLRI